MKRIAVGIAAAVLVAGAAFEAGRVAGPRRALAQEEAAGPNGPRAAPHKLPQPYDVIVHLKPELKDPAGSLGNVVASGVQTWDNETVGGYTFLRLSVASGKLWYIPLENVGYITATPILAPTSPDVQTPAPPTPP